MDLSKFKSFFIDNYPMIEKAKSFVENDNSAEWEKYYHYTILNPRKITNKTISIVMTTCNRSKQTYYTLDTICRSSFKDIQIIIVDDTICIEPSICGLDKWDLISVDKLMEYNLHIEYIKIIKKFWINPCVNYNLGFRFIKGDRVIIQNGEVCHIGDVISNVDSNLPVLGGDGSCSDKKYLVYDVMAMANLNCNEALYNIEPIYSNMKQFNFLYSIWYQHSTERNKGYHFLTTLRSCDLKSVGGFDLDYAMAICYDDDNFILKLKHNAHLEFINITNNNEVFGIHQWHPSIATSFMNSLEKNDFLFRIQQRYVLEHGRVYSLLDDKNLSVEEKIQKLLL